MYSSTPLQSAPVHAMASLAGEGPKKLEFKKYTESSGANDIVTKALVPRHRRSAHFLRALHSLSTRLLCNMQRKLGCRGRKKKREDNRGEYFFLFPFSAPCVDVARAASVVQVTSVRGASMEM